MHVYKVSSTQKTCKIGIIIGKTGALYNYRLLVKLNNGQTEYIYHLNGIEDGTDNDPGWYLMV